ncbi:Vacuolar_ATP synthase 16 kDa proteolipid subunit [Hexamita inflata]|uniref:Vacuolar ATP synthase 16 kDa proteolipid subunit n=1 Tax=Hexamita inflata TaxID=28002 RepID=A0AA86Q3J7_9EUKA|nr:Vacuolar ATP synthase 16 kDa proteolipid subunit [Hexamita inflata]CAI9920738.1 Vacuolar ATP synthase 16 kDa proteolipid subunit [Hexamita inflata]CAI9951301.1 Vacuolar ATP synthase 16 kDa proteolipid subunit [Hexamita inflata]
MCKLWLERLQAWIQTVSPYQFSYTGIFTALALSILGAGLGIYMIGASLTQATVHHPEIKSKNLISILFCEAIALYGIIMAIITFSTIPSTQATFLYVKAGYQGPQKYDAAQLKTEVSNLAAGYGQGFGGISVGFANLFAAITVGVLGSSLVIAHANAPAIFVKLFISEVFAEAIALIGLICGIVMALGVKYE